MPKVITVGNVVADSIVRSINDERDVLNFTVADNESYGEDKEHVEYVDCAIFGKTGTLNKMAENLIVKGQTLYVEGSLRKKIQRDDEGNYTGENTTVWVDRDTLKPIGKKPAAA